MLKEFKEFIQRGNVLELAVGFLMATYFGAITKSLVNDIIMPPIGLALGEMDFADLRFVLKEAQTAVVENGAEISPAVAEVSINYGNFINTIITFLIVALVAFMLVRSYNRYLKKQEESPAPPPPQPTEEVQLLKEIRDELAKRN